MARLSEFNIFFWKIHGKAKSQSQESQPRQATRQQPGSKSQKQEDQDSIIKAFDPESLRKSLRHVVPFFCLPPSLASKQLAAGSRQFESTIVSLFTAQP